MEKGLRLLLLCSIFLFYSFYCHANTKIDSLLNSLAKVDEKEKPAILNSVGQIYFKEKKDSTQALHYFRLAHILSGNQENSQEVVNSLYNIGDCYYEFNNYGEALDSYNEALEIAKNIFGYRLDDIYNNIGLLYFRLNDHDAAIENYLEGIRNAETDSEEMAHLYINIGNVYSTVNNPAAIIYFQNAVSINKKLQNEEKLASNYSAIGTYYYETNKFDSARVYYNYALEKFVQINHEERVAIVRHNLANVYSEMKDSLRLALNYFDEALKTFKKLNNTRHIIYLMESKGAAYTALGDYNRALETFRDGLQIALNEQVADYYILMKYYSDLSKLYEEMGRTTNAYQSYKLYTAYKDSILEERQMARISELEIKFNLDKKEEEIKLLTTEKAISLLEVQKLKIIRLSTIIVIVLLSVLIVYILIEYQAKRKTNRILEEKNEQINKINVSQTKFLSILAHDLRNPFHSVLGYSLLLNKDYNKFPDDKRKQFAGDIYKFAGNIYQLLQNLLDWSRTLIGQTHYNPANFEFQKAYDVVTGLLKPLADMKSITINDNIPEKLEVYADFLMVQSILNNLIANAVKFSNRGSKIILTANFDASIGKIMVTVKDEGAGLSKEKIARILNSGIIPVEKRERGEPGSGLGLIICREYLAFHKEKLKIESEPGKGSTFIFNLPPSLPSL